MSNRKETNKLIKNSKNKELRSAFDRFASNIKFYTLNNNINTFAITSGLKDEGKTTVAINLAMSLTSNNAKCLLIDADIHHKSLSAVYSNPKSIKLYDVFSGHRRIEEAIVHTDINNMYFLDCASGVASIPALISSPEFKDIWNTLKNSFDFVILDTPPVLPCVETTMLCKLAGACFQIVRQNKSKEEEVLQTFDQLKTYGANVIGSVLTFSTSTEYKYYSSYSYYN